MTTNRNVVFRFICYPLVFFGKNEHHDRLSKLKGQIPVTAGYRCRFGMWGVSHYGSAPLAESYGGRVKGTRSTEFKLGPTASPHREADSEESLGKAFLHAHAGNLWDLGHGPRGDWAPGTSG